MDTDTFNGYEVVIGECSSCKQNKVLIRYMGECYCTKCIKKDDHLSAIIGWQ
ncbi:MAG: hypothetical protein ACMXYG_05375 [Candidatus Woesearchaeota archaeon]